MATILIAEDERDLNNLLRKHLEDEGHRVLQALDGPSALLYAGQAPDLVILDWMLPRLDGLEVCRRIRRTSIVPILILTARSEEVDRVLGLEVGADDYLTKPFSVRELLASARSCAAWSWIGRPPQRTPRRPSSRLARFASTWPRTSLPSTTGPSI
jgi:DNA-binding response OmpR family regulator